MAKRTKLDSYLASLRTTQISDNTIAAPPGAPKLEISMPPHPIDDADAADVADALAGDPRPDAPGAVAPAIIGRTTVPGIGLVAVLAHPDGQPDRAVVATGQTIAKYRRLNSTSVARRWWACKDAVSGQRALDMLTALNKIAADEHDPKSPACDRPEIDRARTATHDGGPIGDEPAPPVRSADPGVCAVIDRIVCPRAQDAAAIKAATLAELRAGSIAAIAAWASAAWLEGRAVILFGDRRRNAELAAAALREACSEHLRAVPARDSYSLAVDDVLAAVGE